MANSVDPYQTSSSGESPLGIHWLSRPVCSKIQDHNGTFLQHVIPHNSTFSTIKLSRCFAIFGENRLISGFNILHYCNISYNTFFLENAYSEMCFSTLFLVKLIRTTAAGVVPCGGRKTSPRTSTIVQFIFCFGPLRSAIIF